MANKEYRQFLTCLINAQHTKGSFTHHNVCTMCSISGYGEFHCMQAEQSGISKYDFEMTHHPVSFRHSDANIK